MRRTDLEDVVLESLRALGGAGTIPEVAEKIWLKHEADLRGSGELFFTWQYDMRWAAQRLRDAAKIKNAKRANKTVWQLN